MKLMKKINTPDEIKEEKHKTEWNFLKKIVFLPM